MIRYLKHHKGFGGTRIPGPGPESPERFARTACLVRKETAVEETILDRTLRIQDAAAQWDTVWKLIYDPVSLCIHIRTATQPELRSFTFHKSWFEPGAPVRMLNLNAPVSLWRNGSAPPAWSRTANRAWIHHVFGKLKKTLDGEIPGRIDIEQWSRHPLECANRQGP